MFARVSCGASQNMTPYRCQIGNEGNETEMRAPVRETRDVGKSGEIHTSHKSSVEIRTRECLRTLIRERALGPSERAAALSRETEIFFLRFPWAQARGISAWETRRSRAVAVSLEVLRKARQRERERERERERGDTRVLSRSFAKRVKEREGERERERERERNSNKTYLFIFSYKKIVKKKTGTRRSRLWSRSRT